MSGTITKILSALTGLFKRSPFSDKDLGADAACDERVPQYCSLEFATTTPN